MICSSQSFIQISDSHIKERNYPLSFLVGVQPIQDPSIVADRDKYAFCKKAFCTRERPSFRRSSRPCESACVPSRNTHRNPEVTEDYFLRTNYLLACRAYRAKGVRSTPSKRDRQLDRKFVRGGSADALSDGSKERIKLAPDLLKASLRASNAL